MRWLAVVVTAGLVACGGGGGGGDSLYDDDDGNGGGGGSSVPTAADITLQLSANSVANSGTDVINVTVTAVDSSRNTAAGIPVQISVDNNAIATVSGSETNEQGRVTAQVGPGSDRSNRIVMVTATSGDIVRSATFSVTGANLTGVPLPAVVSPGAAGQIQFRLLDAKTNGIPNETIIVAGPDGVETTGRTSETGEYIYQYRAPASSPSELLQFRAAAGGDELTQSVRFNTGVTTVPPATLNSVRAASVSANPNVIAVNDVDSTTSRSEIRALFVGDNNKPISNVRVRFDLSTNANSNDGTFLSEETIVYSNQNGVATTSYIAGTRSSPTDGVTIRACWDYNDFAVGTCPNAVTTTLTVSAEALSVSIGNDATIGIGASQLTYVKRFVVTVSDASGRAVSGVLVTPTLDLLRYYKGVWNRGLVKWTKEVRATCDNEDLNRNGINEVYADGTIEDANGSLNFTPGRPALEPRRADVTIVTEGSNRTNASGQVVLRIEYPQSVASWVSYNLVVSAAGVAGTEGRANSDGILPVLADEVGDVETDVPFEESPYGIEASPTVSAINPDNPQQRGMLCTNPR
jgi:hypothetical protein